jgi:hypothetical protein
MGVLIKLPGDNIQFASISDNLISIQKRTWSDGETTTYTWVTTCSMSIWKSEEDYINRKDPCGRYNVMVNTDEQPTDIYTIIYDEYKSSIYSYEDKF